MADRGARRGREFLGRGEVRLGQSGIADRPLCRELVTDGLEVADETITTLSGVGKALRITVPRSARRTARSCRAYPSM